ncbi:hypothetical protein ACWT_4732 [Actinoplanes sp. SE50]|uniref:SEC-C domain-containing protein n=1 Tax=unclassified Actinoplanes TaxID=2626549 RepID=UPI00023EBF5D|nr:MULTISPECIES: SEC-C domain-containing protein [unclassified Actinoplanes]AEV85754.1 hypothetical protein ACPL_4863 [Actinoplanes sp. SE50/110]ATO84147.1 hypothetical protein ACWT_4732 [Actinoplanes sp. SE50]SLM01557.1 uncharacterized protein ACSP50_4793 [Actinoplanes sp. SE50/110]
MPLKAELTSADLLEIRQTALGEADPLGLAADLAEAAENGRLADPADAGAALVLAAEIAETRSRFEAALRYAERAVETYGDRQDSPAAGARAVRARLLFHIGRGDEAMAELEALRPTLEQYPDAPAYLSVALEIGGRLRVAEQWLSEAVQAALAERGPEPSGPDEAGQLLFLLQQRHRVRHALNLPHDAHDNLAQRLEDRLAGAGATTGDQLLFFPESELGKVLAEWPGLADAYGADWTAHRARLEGLLARLSAAGQANLAALRGSAEGLRKAAGRDGDPADAEVRARYARQIATGSGPIPWPPERNGACWCGSGTKYKKCCLPRGRA